MVDDVDEDVDANEGCDDDGLDGGGGDDNLAPVDVVRMCGLPSTGLDTLDRTALDLNLYVDVLFCYALLSAFSFPSRPCASPDDDGFVYTWH